MKLKVVTLANKEAGEIELADAVFGLEPRKDILARMVEYQRAKARAGTHQTKTRSDVSGGGAKPFKQKGTGRARQGTTRAPQMEGGGKAHGPVTRSHVVSLPKKIRQLAMKHALSTKAKAGALTILDEASSKDGKTKAMAASFAKLGWNKPLIIAGAEVDAAFAKAARNIKGTDVLPVQGANVLDILKHKELVLTKEAAEKLQERLS